MSGALENIEKRHFKNGETVFYEGEVESHFFIVESGSVLIFTKDFSGKVIPLQEVREGESFGEFALLSNMPRSATARALTDVTLVKVSAEGFQQLVSELPTWAECMLKSFVDRLQNMTDKIRELERRGEI